MQFAWSLVRRNLFPSRLTSNTISFQVSPQDIYAEDEEVFRKRGAEKRQQPESRQRGYQQQRQEEQPRYRDSSEGRRRFVDMEKEAVSADNLRPKSQNN